MFVPKEGASIGSETLGKLNEEATGAKTKRIELESILAQVDKVRKSGDSLDSLPQIASDPLVQRLNMSKADLDVELVQLKPLRRHPKPKQVLTQIEQIRTHRRPVGRSSTACSRTTSSSAAGTSSWPA
jgi:uncharacterized protein involved in exopolysaccharide biosynthesis